MAPQHPREYHQTSQQDLAIFYHQIICCATKCTLIQAINYGSFATCPRLTAKIIIKYLPESEITAKGNLNQQNQRSVESAAANVTPIVTKAGENTNEIPLQIFDPTEYIYSDLTRKFTVQSYRDNNYIPVSYHFDSNKILTTPLKNRT